MSRQPKTYHINGMEFVGQRAIAEYYGVTISTVANAITRGRTSELGKKKSTNYLVKIPGGPDLHFDTMKEVAYHYGVDPDPMRKCFAKHEVRVGKVRTIWEVQIKEYYAYLERFRHRNEVTYRGVTYRNCAELAADLDVPVDRVRYLKTINRFDLLRPGNAAPKPSLAPGDPTSR